MAVPSTSNSTFTDVFFDPYPMLLTPQPGADVRMAVSFELDSLLDNMEHYNSIDDVFYGPPLNAMTELHPIESMTSLPVAPEYCDGL